MTPSTDPRALPVAFPLPAAASALTDIVMAACQRSMSLHAQLVDQMVGVGIEQSRHAFTDPRAALRDAVLTTSTMEPVWRYAMGLAGIGQTAVSSVATLVTAQMRGADAEVESLSRRAREDMTLSTERAAGDARTAMNHGLAAFGRLAQTATRGATDAVVRGASETYARASEAYTRVGAQAANVAQAAGSAIEDAVDATAPAPAPQHDERAARARAHAATKARAARSSARGTPRGKGPGKAAAQHAGPSRGGARTARGGKKAGKRS